MTVGEWIREARQKRGLSLRALGSLVRVSATHLSDIENGHRHPGMKLANRLEKALGVRTTCGHCGHVLP